MNRCLCAIAPFAATVLLATALTACGGGGVSSLPATGGSTPAQPIAPTQNATAKMVVNIPAKTSDSAMRNPHYISASTKSMTIGILAGSKTTQIAEIDLTATSPNCSVISGGVTQCNVSFITAPGTNTFVLTMYDQTGGKGNALSTGDVNATLVAGKSTTVAVDLDGVPANLSVILGPATLPVGTASSTAVFVQATDADGNLIIGPGGFASAISLTIGGDTYNTLSLSTTSVTSPGQVVSLAYSGGTNVGSTITASTTGVTSASATFAGSGASLTTLSWQDLADNLSYAYTYAIQPIPNTNPASAAVLMSTGTCCSGSGPNLLGIVTPSGVQTVFAGDTVDPLNTPAPGSVTFSGPITVVHGMSENLVTWEGDEVSKELAVTSAGKIYYAAYDSTSSAANCPGASESMGVLGLLDPVAKTTVERVLRGYPMYMQLDGAGNLWFIEDTGVCSGVALLPSGFGVGELTASGALTETDFATTGLGGVNPYAMQLSNDGTKMYVADDNTGKIVQIALPSLAAGTTIAPQYSKPQLALAIAPDNTLAWGSNYDPGTYYYYGWLGSSGSPIDANYPLQGYYSAGIANVDASFWFAGYATGTGILRTSNWASGAMSTAYYPMPDPSGFGQTMTGIAGGDGYIWAGDDNYGNIDVLQYGVQSAGTVTYTATRHLGTVNDVRNARPGPHHRSLVWERQAQHGNI